MTTVYVVFGDHSEKIAQYLTGQFEISGFSRTLEAATVAVEKIKEKPDVFLILGSAMVTGMVDGVVNYNAVLLEYLKKIRLTCPESSIKLIISEKAGKSLIEGIVALAIYDIYRADKINVEDLPEIILTKKTIANYSDDIKLRSQMQEKLPKGYMEVVSQEKEARQTLAQRLKTINLFGHEGKIMADQTVRVITPHVVLSMANELNERFCNMFSGLTKIVANKKTETNKQYSNFLYEICPHEDITSSKEDNETHAQLEPPPQPELPQDKPSIRRVTIPTPPPIKVKTIAISNLCSPGTDLILATILASSLARTGKVTAIDCDMSSCGLAFRLGHNISGNDWRRGDPPVALPGIVLYPLDPSYHNENINEENLKTILNEAGIDTDYLIVNVGTDPKTWWFNSLLKYSNIVIWVVSSNPPLLQQVISKWPKRPRVNCRELMVLYGPGDTEAIESAFTLPCIQVKSEKDKKGIRGLIDAISSIPAKNGLRVMAVGFDNIPDEQGIIFDPFQNVDEAISWVKYNRPDIAIINPNLEKISLLEYDLKKYGIAAYKSKDFDAVIKIIQNLQ